MLLQYISCLFSVNICQTAKITEPFADGVHQRSNRDTTEVKAGTKGSNSHCQKGQKLHCVVEKTSSPSNLRWVRNTLLHLNKVFCRKTKKKQKKNSLSRCLFPQVRPPKVLSRQDSNVLYHVLPHIWK